MEKIIEKIEALERAGHSPEECLRAAELLSLEIELFGDVEAS